jgi:hypothetical protein
MPHLPAIIADGGDRPSRYLVRAQHAQDSAELEVFKHEIQAAALSAIDQIDAQTLADAARSSLEEELRLLDEGLARAGSSKAAIELVSRKLNILANINDRRISRRFGR